MQFSDNRNRQFRLCQYQRLRSTGILSTRAKSSKISWLYLTHTSSSLFQLLDDIWLSDILVSHSSLMKMLVSGQGESVQFFPPFITRMQADTAMADVQHSMGRDKQALPARWNVYVFPSSQSIFKYLFPVFPCVFVPLRYMKHCLSMISCLTGID